LNKSRNDTIKRKECWEAAYNLAWRQEYGVRRSYANEGIALAKEMISNNEIRIRKPLKNEPPRIVPFALPREDDVRVLILIARGKLS
jgi:hypothetical protein